MSFCFSLAFSYQLLCLFITLVARIPSLLLLFLLIFPKQVYPSTKYSTTADSTTSLDLTPATESSTSLLLPRPAPPSASWKPRHAKHTKTVLEAVADTLPPCARRCVIEITLQREGAKVACSTPSTGNNLAPRRAPAFSDSHDDTRDLFDNSKHPYVHVSSLDDVDAVYGSRTADRDWDVCGGRGKGDGEVLRGVGVLGRSDDVDEASEPGIDAAARECLCGNGTEVEYFFAVMACIRGEDGGSKERELSGWEMCSLEEAIETARGAWGVYSTPLRSRKRDLLAPLVIEGPAIVCALLRLWARWKMASRLELDDWIMGLAMILYVPFEIVGSFAAHRGIGVDIWTVEASSMTRTMMFIYIAETLYLAILALTKLSILCFYLRVFPQHRFRILTMAVMGWIALSGIIFVFLQLFQCVPINYIWEEWKRGPFGQHRCLDINKASYAAALSSIAQDVVILIMPLPLLWKLRISWRDKASAIAMFSIGFFVTVTSCIRLRAMHPFGNSPNPTWDYTDAAIWTGIEVAVSIIVPCLPPIRAFAKWQRGKMNRSLEAATHAPEPASRPRHMRSVAGSIPHGGMTGKSGGTGETIGQLHSSLGNKEVGNGKEGNEHVDEAGDIV